MPNRPKGHRLRKGRFSENSRIYLITTVTQNRRPVFAELHAGRILAQTLNAEQARAITLAFVIMPDHLHWLMQITDKRGLTNIVADIKSVSAHRINKHLNQKGKLWQSGFHDHAVRKDEDIPALARYILANPLRANLVGNIGDYPLWDAIWI